MALEDVGERQRTRDELVDAVPKAQALVNRVPLIGQQFDDMIARAQANASGEFQAGDDARIITLRGQFKTALTNAANAL